MIGITVAPTGAVSGTIAIAAGSWFTLTARFWVD
jgi:hypothetical protein